MNSKLRETILFAVIITSVIAIAVISIVNAKKDSAEMVVAVHVKGEVKVPGYYELSYGSRIKDAIEYAGGLTENAETDSINLAQKLVDGQELIIKAATGDKPVEEDNGKININTATASELCTLPGVGEELAADIMEYRTKNGAFSIIDDIKNVSGIGESKYKKIKEYITV